MLGRRHRRRVGREAHGDATGRRRLHVDGVVPDAGARDHPQPRSEVHRRAVPAAATGDHGVGAGKIAIVRADDDGTTLDQLDHALGHHPVEEEHRRRIVVRHRPQCTTSPAPPVAPAQPSDSQRSTVASATSLASPCPVTAGDEVVAVEPASTSPVVAGAHGRRPRDVAQQGDLAERVARAEVADVRAAMLTSASPAR